MEGRRLARAAVAAGHAVVDAAALAALVGLLLAGSYALWDSAQVDAAARSVRWAALKPDGAGGARAFEGLRRRNPDVCGWLELYGTEIDQPICWSADGSRYLDHDASGAWSLSGALFAMAPSEPGLSGARTIVFGHHMDGGAMFGQLGDYADEGFFQKHRFGRLWSRGRWEGVEVVGHIACRAFDDGVYGGAPDDAAALARALLARSHPRQEGASLDGRRVLLLSTCSTDGTDARDVVVALLGGEPRCDDAANAAPSPVTIAALPGADPLEAPGICAAASLAVAAASGLLLRRDGAGPRPRSRRHRGRWSFRRISRPG